MIANIRIISSTVGFGVILLILVAGWAGQKYATSNASRSLVKLATSPIGATLKIEQPLAREKEALPQANEAPSKLTVVAPQVTGGAPLPPVKDAAPSPTWNAPTPGASEATAPVKAAEDGLSLAARHTKEEEARKAPVAMKEPVPVPQAEAPRSMQDGGVVAGGRQAPALKLVNLSSADIRRLVGKGRAYIVAESELNGAVLVLDSFERTFRSGRDIPESLMSTRYVRITDPALISALQIKLGQLPTEKFGFGMRFSRDLDATIAERQFASLAAHGIDFEQALALGRTIITRGRFGPDLTFEIQTVSVE